MAQWSIWDWIAYGCLAISAFGTAIGTILQKYPQILNRMPFIFSSSLWSFVPAVFLTIATVIFVWRLFIPSPVVDKSELTLQTYGELHGARCSGHKRLEIFLSSKRFRSHKYSDRRDKELTNSVPNSFYLFR